MSSEDEQWECPECGCPVVDFERESTYTECGLGEVKDGTLHVHDVMDVFHDGESKAPHRVTCAECDYHLDGTEVKKEI